eukprot:156277-Pyramimonas_sp.AAC.1
MLDIHLPPTPREDAHGHDGPVALPLEEAHLLTEPLRGQSCIFSRLELGLGLGRKPLHVLDDWVLRHLGRLSPKSRSPLEQGSRSHQGSADGLQVDGHQDVHRVRQPHGQPGIARTHGIPFKQ